ncbi:MAG TPA: hypothetical protein VH062_17005 [Polyangiaceae bacterium]|jgi:hypothetical protein|nr:hypothetical protein [Polyangiaceae bacterium]
MLPACVAIHVVAAAATPVDTDALLARCNGILGEAECRLENEPATPADCWRATVTLDDRGARAAIELRGTSDELLTHRDVHFDARDQVKDRGATLGLVVAALVTVEEHSAAGTASEPASKPPAPPPPAPSSLVPSSPAPSPPVPARGGHRPDVELSVNVLGSVGFLPSVAFGVRVEGAAYVGPFGALLRAEYTPPASEATIAIANGVGGGRFSAWALGAGLCARARPATPLSFRGCLGGDLEATTATGFGVEETSSATAVFGTAWLALGTELRFSRHFAAALDVDGLVATERPAFAIRGAPTVFTPARAGGRAALGLAYVF